MTKIPLNQQNEKIPQNLKITMTTSQNLQNDHDISQNFKTCFKNFKSNTKTTLKCIFGGFKYL